MTKGHLLLETHVDLVAEAQAGGGVLPRARARRRPHRTGGGRTRPPSRACWRRPASRTSRRSSRARAYTSSRASFAALTAGARGFSRAYAAAMTTATAAQLSDSARVFVEAAPHKLLIGEEWVEAASGETFETIDPGDRRRDLRGGEGGCRGRGPRRQGGAGRPRRRVEPDAGLGARAADARARRPGRQERRRAGRARGARQRQAGHVRRRGGRGGHGRAPALLRRLADQDRGRDDPRHLAERLRLHAQGARRRLRPDHPVELPAADGGLEDRARRSPQAAR